MPVVSVKHISFLCSRLDLPGGIERAIVNTANLFAGKGHTVTLLVLDETDKSFYPIHSSVQVIRQSMSFGITKEGNIVSRKFKLLSDVLELRKLLKKLHTDLVIATEYPFATAAVLSGAKKYARLVSWEHHHFSELKKSSFWNRMFRLTYPKLHGVICLNEEEKKLFEQVNSNPIVIPNFIERNTRSSLSDKLILTIARLTHVKGIDLLLQAAAIVLKQHRDWKWKLIGEGEMKRETNDFIANQNLGQQLILQQPVDQNIMGEYREASFYVMTSRYECFPMTLLEAQSAGLPCISFDCDTGPRHIIDHNTNGILVKKEDATALATAITSLINNEEKKKLMGENAWQSVQQFNPEKIYEIWSEKVLTL